MKGLILLLTMFGFIDYFFSEGITLILIDDPPATIKLDLYEK